MDRIPTHSIYIIVNRVNFGVLRHILVMSQFKGQKEVTEITSSSCSIKGSMVHAIMIHVGVSTSLKMGLENIN